MPKMEVVEMEVEGRHAMLFDDDAMSDFGNSNEALIQWNDSSLFIDRFDVRNLITNPPPSFRKLPLNFYGGSSPFVPDPHLEAELDLERYADLSNPSSDEQRETGMELAVKDAEGYHFVPFSYGDTVVPTDQMNSDVDQNVSVFHPPFPVPENLLQNLPPSEKVHQIIARTAIFVSEHGGQSEIVLRVKQGDNPTFGFLMPHHHLHPYFRYLVDHPGVLTADMRSKPMEEKTNNSQASEALSLLGSIYGYGEDEDMAAEVDREHKPTDSGGTSTAPEALKSCQSVQTVTSGNESQISKTESKLTETMKAKIAALRNAINSNKPAQSSGIKKDGNVIASAGFSINQPKASSLFPINQPSTSSLFPINQPKEQSLFPVAEVDTSLVDPPSEVKRLVDRMVEIILKNGKDYEAVLIEQDKRHGKYLFLLPSNQYHPYYLKVLKKAQESRTSGKSYISGKDGSTWQEIDKNTATAVKEKEFESLGSGSDDLPLDDDRKEKFKMVIVKAKKDTQDQPSKESQCQGGFTVDTEAAAAILQAATRGIRKPNFDIFSRTSKGSICVGGQASAPGSLQSSQLQNSAPKEKGGHDARVPVANEFAKIAARAADSEVDSDEAGLTREQKLKAERLRRAKMFAAKIKSGAASLGTESIRAVSAEPPVSGNSGSAPEAVNEVLKEGSSAQILKSGQKSSDDENERKSKKTRHYRSRRHDDSEAGEEDVGSREEDVDDGEKHSKKRHRSHHSSRHHRDRSKDRHKHRRRHSSTKREESRHRHKHEGSVSVEEDDHHHHHMHDSTSEDEHKHHKRRHRHDFSSEDEHRHHKQRQRRDSSSEDERKHHKRRHKHSKKDKRKHGRRSDAEEAELEEGEIRTKSSDLSPTLSKHASREASVDISKSPHQDKRTASLPPTSTTEVPDELRAKIRAMLLATM